MTVQQAQDPVRALRKQLVLEAEAAMESAIKEDKLEKTQLSNLVGVCTEATCHEEIANYLRYQAGRDIWPRRVVEDVLKRIEALLPKQPDAARVDAWRRYATYMKRSYTYLAAVKKDERGGRR